MSRATFDQLSAEHRCLLVLAEELEEQAAALPGGAPSDLQAMLDQAVRLREFFTGAHGPKDEAVVAKAFDGDQGLQALMTPFLHTETNRFLDSLLAMEAGLQAAMLDQIVPTRTIVEHAEEAVRHLRAQIAMEESATYPWVRRRIGSRGRLELARQIALIGERWPHDPCVEPVPIGAWARPLQTRAELCACSA